MLLGIQKAHALGCAENKYLYLIAEGLSTTAVRKFYHNCGGGGLYQNLRANGFFIPCTLAGRPRKQTIRGEVKNHLIHTTCVLAVFSYLADW